MYAVFQLAKDKLIESLLGPLLDWFVSFATIWYHLTAEPQNQIFSHEEIPD